MRELIIAFLSENVDDTGHIDLMCGDSYSVSDLNELDDEDLLDAYSEFITQND